MPKHLSKRITAMILIAHLDNPTKHSAKHLLCLIIVNMFQKKSAYHLKIILCRYLSASKWALFRKRVEAKRAIFSTRVMP